MFVCRGGRSANVHEETREQETKLSRPGIEEYIIIIIYTHAQLQSAAAAVDVRRRKKTTRPLWRPINKQTGGGAKTATRKRTRCRPSRRRTVDTQTAYRYLVKRRGYVHCNIIVTPVPRDRGRTRERRNENISCRKKIKKLKKLKRREKNRERHDAVGNNPATVTTRRNGDAEHAATDVRATTGRGELKRRGAADDASDEGESPCVAR